jgi:hypothetical protein
VPVVLLEFQEGLPKGSVVAFSYVAEKTTSIVAKIVRIKAYVLVRTFETPIPDKRVIRPRLIVSE